MFGMGPWELALVVLAILLLFGARRLPEIAQNMGKGIREFKRAMREGVEDSKGGSLDAGAPPTKTTNGESTPKGH